VYLLLIFVVVLLVFSMVQNNRRRKNVSTMQSAIEPGVRIMTTSGIYGIVQEVESDSIIIEISEGVDVRFAKAAVMKVVPHLDDTVDTDDLDDLDEVDVSDRADRDHLADGIDGPDDVAHADGDARPAVRPADVRPADVPPVDVRPAQTEPASVDGHQPGAGSVSTG
jgi:preprotein translocase subunit YajC